MRVEVLRAVGCLWWALSFDACAFQSDVHYQATFALALATGWSWDDAKLIAGTR
jgi:hypothetical protein